MAAFDALPIEGAHVAWVDELPESLPGAARVGAFLQAKPGDALFELPGIARFRIREGRTIEIAVSPGCTRERAASFARISPFGVLLHQRGELPLHASAVMRPSDGKVLLIAGASGAGKSTTAGAFAQRGWKVLNDDVSRITCTGSDVLVWPGFNALKLWDRSCRFLNLDYTTLPGTGEFKQKYLWFSERVEGPRPVSAIVELHRSADSDIGLERVRGAAAVQLLCRHTFRRRFIRPLGRHQSHFSQVAKAASRTPCFRFVQDHSLPPPEVAERLEEVLH